MRLLGIGATRSVVYMLYTLRLCLLYTLSALTQPLLTALQMYYAVDNIRYSCTSCYLLAPFIIHIMPQYLYVCPFFRLTSKHLSTIKECGIVEDLLLTYGGFTLALH